MHNVYLGRRKHSLRHPLVSEALLIHRIFFFFFFVKCQKSLHMASQIAFQGSLQPQIATTSGDLQRFHLSTFILYYHRVMSLVFIPKGYFSFQNKAPNDNVILNEPLHISVFSSNRIRNSVLTICHVNGPNP